jgi:hypothetical protein
VVRTPGLRLRDIAIEVGITERAAHRIVTELADAGYVTRRRVGRRNHYIIQSHLPVPDPLARCQNVGELLAILAGTDSTETRPARPQHRVGARRTAR